MRQPNNTSLRERLEPMSTAELDALLQAELHREPPDKETLLVLVELLKQREAGNPVQITPEIEEAWTAYRRDMDKLDRKYSRRRRASVWLARAASVAVIVGVLLAALVPQSAQAESFWKRLARWTDSIFEFINPGAEESEPEEYVFRTDNPGLQQVYDAVVEMGVTEPVVPMWLPEGYELVVCSTDSTPAEKYVWAIFSNEKSKITFKLSVYMYGMPSEYEKDETQVRSIEMHGITYNIMHNNAMWAVVWTKENIEWFFTIDCQEDTLNKILKSIYTMEAD